MVELYGLTSIKLSAILNLAALFGLAPASVPRPTYNLQEIHERFEKKYQLLKGRGGIRSEDVDHASRYIKMIDRL